MAMKEFYRGLPSKQKVKFLFDADHITYMPTDAVGRDCMVTKLRILSTGPLTLQQKTDQSTLAGVNHAFNVGHIWDQCPFARGWDETVGQGSFDGQWQNHAGICRVGGNFLDKPLASGSSNLSPVIWEQMGSFDHNYYDESIPSGSFSMNTEYKHYTVLSSRINVRFENMSSKTIIVGLQPVYSGEHGTPQWHNYLSTASAPVAGNPTLTDFLRFPLAKYKKLEPHAGTVGSSNGTLSYSMDTAKMVTGTNIEDPLELAGIISGASVSNPSKVWYWEIGVCCVDPDITTTPTILDSNSFRFTIELEFAVVYHGREFLKQTSIRTIISDTD